MLIIIICERKALDMNTNSEMGGEYVALQGTDAKCKCLVEQILIWNSFWHQEVFDSEPSSVFFILRGRYTNFTGGRACQKKKLDDGYWSKKPNGNNYSKTR